MTTGTDTTGTTKHDLPIVPFLDSGAQHGHYAHMMNMGTDGGNGTAGFHSGSATLRKVHGETLSGNDTPELPVEEPA